jgi:hypothetical protein
MALSQLSLFMSSVKQSVAGALPFADLLSLMSVTCDGYLCLERHSQKARSMWHVEECSVALLRN